MVHALCTELWEIALHTNTQSRSPTFAHDKLPSLINNKTSNANSHMMLRCHGGKCNQLGSADGHYAEDEVMRLI